MEEDRLVSENECGGGVKKRPYGVLRFRVTVCAAAAIAAAVVKLMGGEVCETVRKLYLEYTFCSIVTDESEDNCDFIRAAENDLQSGQS